MHALVRKRARNVFFSFFVMSRDLSPTNINAAQDGSIIIIFPHLLIVKKSCNFLFRNIMSSTVEPPQSEDLRKEWEELQRIEREIREQEEAEKKERRRLELEKKKREAEEKERIENERRLEEERRAEEE